MDIKAPSKKISQELARESLIAISYCLPDKVTNLDVLPPTVNGEVNGEGNFPVIKGDEAEKYRSELISISYSQSPDVTPVAVENDRTSKN